MSQHQRFTVLDGMRGIAAFAVMSYHMTQHTSRRLFSNAGLAVDLFFCLSGFVIAFSYLGKLKHGMTTKQYILKRIIRLYPMYIIGLVFGFIALLIKVYEKQTNLTLFDAASAFALNAIYLPYVSHFYVGIANAKVQSAIFPTNDPSWSLFFELIVNILFGLIAYRARRIHFIFLAIAGAIGLALWIKITWNAQPGWGAGNIVGGLPRVFYSFFAGVVVFFLFEKFQKYIPNANPVYLILLLLVLLTFQFTAKSWLIQVIFVIPFIVLLGAKSAANNKFAIQSLDYLGWISYPIYCIHWPVYSIFTSISGNVVSTISSLAVCVPLSLFLAHFISKKMEEPIRGYFASSLFHK